MGIYKNIDFTLELQKKYFSTQETKNIDFRIRQLKILKNAIEIYEEKILIALKLDLNKCEFEAYETEIGVIISEIKHTIKKLKAWSKPEKIKTPLMNIGSKSYIYKQPYGLCLIMSPWNYPFQLCISPLIGSIIGGNCSIIKPSELSPNTSKVIKEMIEAYFDEKYISVIEGEIEINQYLLSKKVDYIFFTGSPNVGKIVMEAASKNLIPCTLELGGKSPCIVDKNADINLSAKKIVWGKFLNAGQTCIAPDYVIVHKSVKKELIYNMIKYIGIFYGKNAIESKDYTGIINKRNFDRILNLIDFENVVYGGQYEEINLKIEPTILNDVNIEDKIMSEEIFGPILPILEFNSIDDILEIIDHHKNPLSLYLFTKDKKFEEDIIDKISFGGGCVNDTIMHITNHNAPFGGIGNSGIGSYHGKKSFETFSHQKSVMKTSFKIDIPFKYPPYTDSKLKLLKNAFKIF